MEEPMYKKGIVRIISLFLVAFFVFSLSLTAFAEGDTKKEKTAAQKTMELLRNPEGRILSVARQGDVSSYPENSWEGIKSAIKKGADIIEVDVRKTVDNYLVLFKDEDFSRMCVDPSGNTITSKVSETEAWEVIAMCLREGRGGEAKEPTECHPQTLEAVVGAVGSNAVLMLNFDSDIRNEVYEEIYMLGALDRVIFKMKGQAGTIKKFISTHSEENLAVMGEYSGNVIFSATGYVKKMKKAGAVASMLSVKNPNGVIFDKSVMKNFSTDIRAAVNMTEKKLCGEREDNENGWNDLLKRGYSIIETDYPEKLAQYIRQYEKEKAVLQKLVDRVSALDMTKYGYKTGKALEKELENSKALLSSHTSKLELNEQYFRLNSAYLSLDSADGSANGRTFNLGRVIAALLIVALFVLSQIIVLRHSKREN
jgi:glycerophosphoryl diester phosphodiesterase